jgi:hypothetical protein
MAVPYFFLASGFFLAGHVGETGWWGREVKKRIFTLLVPLVFWCVIGSLWAALWTAGANHLAGRPLGHDIPFCNGQWLPGVGILWFIRNLFLLVIVSKAIVWLIDCVGWLWVAVCFLVYWSVYTCLNPVAPELAWQEFLVYGFSLEGLTYFSLGMFLRMKHVDLQTVSSPGKVLTMFLIGLPLLAMSLLANLTLQAPMAGLMVNFRHFCLPFLIVAVWSLMPEKQPVKWLAGAAFPVYILHGMVNTPVVILLKRVTFLDATIVYLLKWLIAFAVCVIIAYAVHKHLPRLSRVVFGGR